MELFDGDTFSQEHDGARLATLLEAVKDLMSDGQWRTLAEIQGTLGRGTEASISARLRDLRKPKFGAHETERQRRGDPGDGLWEYRVLLNPNPPSPDAITTTTKRQWSEVATALADLVRQVDGQQAPEWERSRDSVLGTLGKLQDCERALEDEDEDDWLFVLDD